MDSNQGTVTVWQSGRLAPQPASHGFAFGPQQWLGTALLLLSAVVLAIYVAVLERDVGAGELAHAAQRSRAVAEARCEADNPAELRGRCIALFNGDVVAARSPAASAPAEVRYEQENAARALTVSLLGKPR